jgi:predicted RNA binding protein YcfA (HicA-like mRNA interferase family)
MPLARIAIDITAFKVYIIYMTGKELLKRLKKAGWELDRISGSHHIMRKGGISISVPVHGSSDIKIGLLESLLKKAGLK